MNLNYIENMKKLLFALLAGVCLTGCASRNERIAIVPYPNEIRPGRGSCAVAGAEVVCDSRADERTQRAVGEFAAQLSAVSGAESAMTVADAPSGPGIRFVVDASLPEEGYRLTVDANGVEARASQFNGFFYALQSIKQLLPAAIYGQSPAPEADWKLPCVEIVDAPRFAYRGMHLDVARHFFSTDEVKRYIDIMAVHKLNRLHWHLTDDQGWRIEIKRYPELTRVGSVRRRTLVGLDPGGEYDETTQYDETPYGGYYTQEDIREVVDYAARRFITVIPEIEFPGHAVGALASCPWLSCTGEPYEVRQTWDIDDRVFCIGRETTFEFIEHVLAEVVELFPSEYVHIGGDECPSKFWEKCPACKARMKAEGLTRPRQLQGYATARVERFLQRYGRRIVGWDEILDGGVTPTAVVMSWRGTQGGIRAARQGNSVIMSPTTHCYLDYYQTDDRTGEPLAIGGCLPLEKVYSLDPFEGLTQAESRHILGVQGNLWTEYVGDPAHAQYMLLPRLSALAEVGWSCDRKDYADYLHRLRRLARIYDDRGYSYGKHVFDN